MDAATLAELLREAAERHVRLAETHAEHHWRDWYAPYLSARQQGSSPAEEPPTATWGRPFTFLPDDRRRRP